MKISRFGPIEMVLHICYVEMNSTAAISLLSADSSSKLDSGTARFFTPGQPPPHINSLLVTLLQRLLVDLLSISASFSSSARLAFFLNDAYSLMHGRPRLAKACFWRYVI